MARKKLTIEVYAVIEGQQVPWYTVDEGGKATYYLPEDKGKAIEQITLKNIEEHMGRYYAAHDFKEN